jgi:hypothetical protein
VVERLYRRTRRQGRIGQESIELLGRQFQEQHVRLVLPADQADVREPAKNGIQDVPHDALGKHVHHADAQVRAAARGSPFQGFHEFAAQGEDAFGVMGRQLARLGQHQPLADAIEEGFPEGALQGADLRAHRRLGKMQALAGEGRIAIPLK